MDACVLVEGGVGGTDNSTIVEHSPIPHMKDNLSLMALHRGRQVTRPRARVWWWGGRQFSAAVYNKQGETTSKQCACTATPNFVFRCQHMIMLSANCFQSSLTGKSLNILLSFSLPLQSSVEGCDTLSVSMSRSLRETLDTRMCSSWKPRQVPWICLGRFGGVDGWG